MVDYSETMEVFEIKVTINNESMKIQVYQRNVIYHLSSFNIFRHLLLGNHWANQS